MPGNKTGAGYRKGVIVLHLPQGELDAAISTWVGSRRSRIDHVAGQQVTSQTSVRPWTLTRDAAKGGSPEQPLTVVRAWDPDGHEMVAMYITGRLTTFHAHHLVERMADLGAPLSEGMPVVIAGNDGAAELVRLMIDRAEPRL
jgi:hypothetical protein